MIELAKKEGLEQSLTPGMVKLENADRERMDRNSEDEVEEKLEDHEYAFQDFDIDDDGFVSVSEV